MIYYFGRLKCCRRGWRKDENGGPESSARRLATKSSSVTAARALTKAEHGAVLACACDKQVALALELFERELLAKLAAFVSRIDGSTPFVSELAQVLRAQLFVDGKIREYSGRGSLEGWLRVVATRLALKLKQRGRAAAHVPLPEKLAMQASTGDPELSYLKEHYRKTFAAELSAALAALSPEERAALKLYYLDELTLEQIAGLWGVNPSTVWRRITRLQETLLAHLRSRSARLGLPDDELESVLRMVRSRIDISLSGLLRSA
jgi:RNA polymerase sigma-70 factor (ECF subfamily)